MHDGGTAPLEGVDEVFRAAVGGDPDAKADELQAAYAPWLVLSVSDREDGWILMTARA